MLIFFLMSLFLLHGDHEMTNKEKLILELDQLGDSIDYATRTSCLAWLEMFPNDYSSIYKLIEAVERHLRPSLF